MSLIIGLIFSVIAALISFIQNDYITAVSCALFCWILIDLINTFYTTKDNALKLSNVEVKKKEEDKKDEEQKDGE